MAYQSLFKMTIQDESGNYYTALQNPDSTWNVTTTTVISYLNVLPDGWEDVAITWERDMTYLGVFRSMTNSAFKFSKDGRAILKNIRSTQGIKGYGSLTIWIINENDFNYSIFYRSQLDFKTYHDFQQTFITEISTLDSGLIRDLHSRGDNDVNIPIWKNIEPDPHLPAIWIPYYNNQWILHNGIKLLYNATYTTPASIDNPLVFGDVISGATIIGGFNGGQHGALPINQGAHTVLNMSPYNIVQNNGATTFVGNDILQPFLIQGNQNQGASGIPGETNFGGNNESRPYTMDNYLLKNLLKAGPYAPTGTLNMNLQINAKITSLPAGSPYSAIQTNGATGWATSYLGFALFEIDKDNNPESIGGDYVPHAIYKLPIINVTSYPEINVSLPIAVNYDKVYVFCLITDGYGYNIDVTNGITYVSFDNLQVSFVSAYDYGRSGVPIPAPSLNPSVFAGYRLHQLWELLVPFLASTQTDSNGFPVPVATDYTGLSDFLSNPSLTVGDCCPYQISLSSAYCIHDLQGQSYITLSANKLFDFCKKALGCGMGIIYDTNGVAVGLRIEDLNYFFNSSTMILDLGYDISDFEVMQGGMEMGIGANLKIGYSKADTNTDFGVDPFNTGLYFKTPVTEVPGVMDLEEDNILTEQYAIEKIRQQKVNQPIGSTFDPANPSSDNPCVALYLEPNNPPFALPDAPLYPFQPYDPDNNPVAVYTTLYQVEQLPTAQSTDSTAATAPYVNGLYYPDTAINLKISPARSLLRGVGAWVHSILDKMDSMYLSFCNTYVMQYNNKYLALSGMASKLDVGTPTPVITEMADKLIGDLPAKLFLPVPVRYNSTSGRNLYHVLNTNPNGYIRFYTKNEGLGYTERKIFLTKATQKATLAGNINTSFEGWLLPDQII